jgi:outer membrane lipoprotein-sorting protein
LIKERNMKISLALVSILTASAVADAATTAGSAPSLPKLTAEQIVQKHVAATGGADAWHNLRSVVFEGQMDAGAQPSRQLPYVLKQTRGHKSRLELTVGDQTALQIYDGQKGWKVRPFTNRTEVETMTPTELAASAAAANDDIDGPLVDYAQKGYKITLVGTALVKGHAAYQLKITSKSGEGRNIWLDGESFMTLKIEGAPRSLDGRKHPVSIYYSDYHAEKGLSFAHEQETIVEQSKAAPTKLTVSKVRVNEAIDPSAFQKPDLPDAAPTVKAQ